MIRDPNVYQRAKVWLSRGVQQWAALSELQAAVLIPQLKKLPQWTANRHERVTNLVALLDGVPGLTLFENRVADSVPAYYKVGFFLDSEQFGLSREIFVKALRAEGIAFDEGFRASHIGRSANRFRASGTLTEAERAHRQVVMLHHPVLSLGNEEIEKVAQAVRKTYRNVNRLRGIE